MNKKIPILFSFRRCPYAMRARIAIKLCDLECEIREINLKLKNKEFLKKIRMTTEKQMKLEFSSLDLAKVINNTE